MPASRHRREKYHYTEETLTRLLECEYCGKEFKSQGIKKHRKRCQQQIIDEQQRMIFESELSQSLPQRLADIVTLSYNFSR